MDDPFINLKNAMKKTVFKDLSFSEERKNAVKERLREKQSNSWEVDTVIAVLESVQDEAKHGYDISTQLLQKNELIFQKNEGQLYTLLHLLENKGILQSDWLNDKKYYYLSSKGKKYLAKYERDNSIKQVSLKHLFEEATL